MMRGMPGVVVIGAADVGRRSCALLAEQGVRTVHLDDPTDADLREALDDDIAGVAVLLHDDIRALRYSLVVEHLRPGIRLFVAMFDGTARAQLEKSVPNCVVLSPAAIAVPSMVAAAIASDHAAIRRRTTSINEEWVSVDAGAPGQPAKVASYAVPARLRRRGLIGVLRGQLRPYDSGSTVLIGGALGLLLVIVVDMLIGLRHETFTRALYDAARTTATIAAPELPDQPGILIWGTLAALLVMGFTAAFAAGIVHHLISGRHTALVGRRVIPRSGHVVIAGMGQVGLRLAQELRSLGVSVLGIEVDRDARGLALARDMGIPVIIGDAASRRVMRRASVTKAIAIVAAASEERDNIAVAVSAQAVAPELTVVLRAGSDDAIDETRSLFHIGSVIDVNGLTSAIVAVAMVGPTPYVAIGLTDCISLLSADGTQMASMPVGSPWCSHD